MHQGSKDTQHPKAFRRSHVLWACAAVSLSLVTSVGAVDFAGGTGTAADPYQLATAAQLVSIGDDPDLLNKHFALVGDIDLDPNLPGGQVFTRAVIAHDDNPHGGSGTAYTGRFYGHGHKVRRLTIESEGIRRIGLFGRIGSAGRVYDLVLEEVRITAVDHAGGLAGLNDGGLVNCSVTGRIRGPNGSSWLGGLVGINTGTLLDCRANVALTTGDRGLMLGLLVGMHRGGILNCSVAGDLSCGADSLHLGGLAGGCVGGIIRDSQASGSIAAGDRSWALGGLAGRADTETVVANSYANAAVTAGSRSHDLGGLIGTCFGVEIANCCAIGNVTGGEQSHSLGGLLGSGLGVAIRNAFATGDVSGFRRLGGFVGSAQTGTSIVNSHAVGRVLRGAEPWGRGGFAGHVERSPDVHVADCFWDIDSSRASASAAGVGLTTAQMQDPRTFQAAGWDMAGDRADGTADLWLMPEGSGHPVLAVFSDQYQPHILEGTGVSSDPYRIATPEDLGAIGRYSPTAWYRLVDDIDLAGIVWSAAPVATFAGILDGRGHRIRNLTLRAEGRGPAGLFGQIASGGWVVDLGLEDIAMAVSGDSAGAGGLAGENAGRVLSCYGTGTVVGGDNCRNLGGLIGVNRLGIVADCYSVAAIRASTDSKQVGGLIGYNYLGLIADCYAAGSVSGGGAESLGALAGQSSEHARTINCYYLAASAGGGPDRGAGVRVTAEEMARRVTFVDWDFKNTWTLCEGRGYPHLQWEGIQCTE